MHGKLIDHVQAPRSGAMNMAVDQSLLESVDHSDIPVLRFYTWQEPTLTLGYFQKAVSRRQHTPSQSLPLVRRSTGGGAIIHDQELTYSLFLPSGRNTPGAHSDIYRQMHDVLMEVFHGLGISVVRFDQTAWSLAGHSHAFLCFQRRTGADLTLGGYKVAGSAQRRFGGAILQHGSVLLRASRYAPSLPGIEELSGRCTDVDMVAREITSRCQTKLDVEFANSELSQLEAQRAAEIAQTRFGCDGWNLRR